MSHFEAAKALLRHQIFLGEGIIPNITYIITCDNINNITCNNTYNITHIITCNNTYNITYILLEFIPNNI